LGWGSIDRDRRAGEPPVAGVGSNGGLRGPIELEAGDAGERLRLESGRAGSEGIASVEPFKFGGLGAGLGPIAWLELLGVEGDGVGVDAGFE
jgi:hypothetical protein